MSQKGYKTTTLRPHSDEPLAPCIPVYFIFADNEAIGVVAETLKLKLALSCGIRFGTTTVDPDELVLGIILIETVFAWSAVPKQKSRTHLVRFL
jgi:hypothetical protein